MSASHHVRIIGIGSPFGEDRLGWLAADAVEAAINEADYPDLQIEVQRLDRPGAALVNALAGTDTAVLIDAMASSTAAGSIRWLTESDLALGPRATSSHGLDVGWALSLARSLGDAPPRIHLLGIQMGQPGDMDAAASERDLQQAIDQIRGLLEGLQAG